ncbi:MAG: hypothetical protein QM756_34030 [Polyangiaceae bacterium]
MNTTFPFGLEQSLRDRYGGASRRHLASRCAELWQAGSAGDVLQRAEAEHLARFGTAKLLAEREDELERDAARSDDAALVAYERKWSRRLSCLQRRRSAYWTLPGLSADELRDELTLRLVEALRSPTHDFTRCERAGREWGLAFLVAERRALRRSYRLPMVLTDPPTHYGAATDCEERLIEEQSTRLLTQAGELAEASLSSSQRRWLSAMKWSANAGGFFAASGALNLAQVSRLLDRNRSSAQRAFEELRHRFASELERLENT